MSPPVQVAAPLGLNQKARERERARMGRMKELKKSQMEKQSFIVCGDALHQRMTVFTERSVIVAIVTEPFIPAPGLLGWERESWVE